MTARNRLAVTVAVTLALPVAALARDALHGTWSATVVADPGSAGKDHDDTLTFTKGDQFSSAWLAKQGYEPAPYADRGGPIGVADTLDVTVKDKAGDTAHWQASEAAGQMTGTLVVTPKGGDPVSYTFKASKG